MDVNIKVQDTSIEGILSAGKPCWTYYDGFESEIYPILTYESANTRSLVEKQHKVDRHSQILSKINISLDRQRFRNPKRPFYTYNFRPCVLYFLIIKKYKFGTHEIHCISKLIWLEVHRRPARHVVSNKLGHRKRPESPFCPMLMRTEITNPILRRCTEK